MKKFLTILLSLLMIVSLVGCGSSEGGGNKKPNQKKDGEQAGTELAGVKIEVAVNFTGDAETTFAKICSDFEFKTGCEIVIDWYGSDYATMMTTRMGADNMPDVFVTAGWSIKKYKEYELDLRDEPYCADYSESALGVIKDEDGSIYVCMLSEGLNGVIYNVNVCEAAGIDYKSIHTWSDFLAACQKVKDAGFTPIASRPNAGLTSNPIGTWLTYENEMYDVSEELLNGTWDWEEYRAVLETYATALNNGYFFTDSKSMSETDTLERMAMGKTAFIIGDNTAAIQTLYEMNPKGNYAFGPFYASTEEGVEAVLVGEGDAFAISNKSANVEACKKFLQYLSTPEVTLTLIGATARTACQKTVMAQDTTKGTEAFKIMQEDFASHNISYENIFDRDYLPASMFGILGNAAGKLWADHSAKGIDDIIDYVKENYDRLYKESKKK